MHRQYNDAPGWVHVWSHLRKTLRWVWAARVTLQQSESFYLNPETVLYKHATTFFCSHTCRHRLSWLFTQNDSSTDLIRFIWSESAAHQIKCKKFSRTCVLQEKCAFLFTGRKHSATYLSLCFANDVTGLFLSAAHSFTWAFCPSQDALTSYMFALTEVKKTQTNR